MIFLEFCNFGTIFVFLQVRFLEKFLDFVKLDSAEIHFAKLDQTHLATSDKRRDSRRATERVF